MSAPNAGRETWTEYQLTLPSVRLSLYLPTEALTLSSQDRQLIRQWLDRWAPSTKRNANGTFAALDGDTQ